MAFIKELTKKVQRKVNGKSLRHITEERIAAVRSQCKNYPCKKECVDFMAQNDLVYYFEGICGGKITAVERAYLKVQREKIA